VPSHQPPPTPFWPGPMTAACAGATSLRAPPRNLTTRAAPRLGRGRMTNGDLAALRPEIRAERMLSRQIKTLPFAPRSPWRRSGDGRCEPERSR